MGILGELCSVSEVRALGLEGGFRVWGLAVSKTLNPTLWQATRAQAERAGARVLSFVMGG